MVWQVIFLGSLCMLKHKDCNGQNKEGEETCKIPAKETSTI